MGRNAASSLKFVTSEAAQVFTFRKTGGYQFSILSLCCFLGVEARTGDSPSFESDVQSNVMWGLAHAPIRKICLGLCASLCLLIEQQACAHPTCRDTYQAKPGSVGEVESGCHDFCHHNFSQAVLRHHQLSSLAATLTIVTTRFTSPSYPHHLILHESFQRPSGILISA